MEIAEKTPQQHLQGNHSLSSSKHWNDKNECSSDNLSLRKQSTTTNQQKKEILSWNKATKQ